MRQPCTFKSFFTPDKCECVTIINNRLRNATNFPLIQKSKMLDTHGVISSPMDLHKSPRVNQSCRRLFPFLTMRRVGDSRHLYYKQKEDTRQLSRSI